jgi:hypothetical protein
MERKQTIFAPDELVPPDPVGDVKPVAGNLPADRDDDSDVGMPVTDHEDSGWRAERWWKP